MLMLSYLSALRVRVWTKPSLSFAGSHFFMGKSVPGWIRTIDTIIKSDVLYQAELRAHKSSKP